MSATRTNTEIFLRKPVRATDAIHPVKSLTAVVEAVVATIDDHALSPLSGRQRLSALDAKRLLALLSWSYARDLYSSAEIHARLRLADSAELWDSGLPDAEGISRFRLENRQALQCCLQAVLHHLAALKVAEGFVTRINDAHIAAEASRRIIRAIFIDQAEVSFSLAA